MNDSRIEFKVGVFVFVGVALLALLILNFTKGNTLGRSTYKLRVILPNAAGLKPAADVMMAGVPVGKVIGTALSPDGRSVDISIELLAKYKIRQDARFHIDALGILGDPYIEITPEDAALAKPENARLLTNGEAVVGDAPFNLQEAGRSISGFLEQAHKAVTDIDEAVTNLNHTVLAVDTLGRVTATFSNLSSFSVDASTMAAQVRGMLDSNAPAVHIAVTNLVAFSEKMDAVAAQLGQTISTNSPAVNEAVKNFRDVSVAAKQLADGLQAGQGAAGALLKDAQTKAELDALLTNAGTMTEQFSLFGLHLNERGIWAMIRKPKASETNAPPPKSAPK